MITMGFLTALILLLYCSATTHANIMWFYSHSDSKVVPIPNLNRALEGYDVVVADSFARIDPGRRKQIFEPLYEESGRTYLQSFMEEINVADRKCDTEFSMTSVKNLNGFLREKRKGYSFFLDILTDERVSKTAEVLESADAKPFDGEVILGKAACVTAVVKIAPFEKPVYTGMFKNALRAFHHASKKPLSLRSKKTAYAFFLTYGTHFMKTVDMGSQVLFWKHSDNTNEDKVKQVSDCLIQVAKKGMADSNGDVVRLAEMFDRNSTNCDSTNGNAAASLLEGSQDIPPKKITVKGVLPNDSLVTWVSDVQLDPVPIHFELMKISYLFRDDWLDFIDTKGRGDLAQDAEAMFRFFETSLVEYCRTILRSDCAEEVHWEGEDFIDTEEQLAHRETLTNDIETRTPRAVKAVTYGKVYVSAGFKNMVSSLKTVDEIGGPKTTSEIPDLPEEMGGHSLTAVGSILYNCGGSSPFKVTHSLHRCYTFDVDLQNSSWSQFVDLPANMKNFHTALRVDSQIWFFDRGSFTVYILKPSTRSFTQYRLPFFITNWMCLTEFNSTVIAIDTNAGVLFILEHPSDPETWSRVEQSLDTRFTPTCIAVNADVYITGDGRSNHSQNIEVYHGQERTVSRIPIFLHSRIGYSLFVSKGAPVVVGGMDRDRGGNIVLSTAEIYNVSSRAWQVDQELDLNTPRVWFGVSQVITENL